MPIDIVTTRNFHLRLYAPLGMLKTVTLLKRNDDQAENVVTSYTLYTVRRSQIFKTDEPIQSDMSASYRTVFHIPRVSLEYIGIYYINSLDRILEQSDYPAVVQPATVGGLVQFNPGENRVWQPEATTTITGKLFENHVCVECLLLSGQPT